MPGPWRLRYGATDFEFSNESGIFLRSFPEIGAPDIRTDDTAIVRGDGDRMGQDFHGGRTIGLSFGVEGRTEDEARDRRDVLEQLWDAEEIRRVGGAVAQLVADSGRIAYGRPRQIADKSVRLSDLPPQIDVEANFQTVDANWYGAPEQQVVHLGREQGGGFTWPTTWPIVWRDGTTEENAFTVAGTRRTWPVIYLRGPVLNPVVQVAGAFRFALDRMLQRDELVVIDTRPGQRSVTRNGRTQRLTRTSSPLASASLAPGRHVFTLSGTSPTGIPTATIEWSPAYKTP